MAVRRDKFGRFIKGSDPINKNNILFNFTRKNWFDLYINQHLSTFNIAKKYNTNASSINKYLIKYNIPIRTPSERQKGRIGCMQGKKHSTKSKLKMSKFLTGRCGVLSRNWQGGLSHQGYPHYFNDKLKLEIRTRDNFTCQYCNISEENYIKQTNHCLDIHHIDYNKMNCKETNLITLCNKCNVKANGYRDYWFAYYTYIIENYIRRNNHGRC